MKAVWKFLLPYSADVVKQIEMPQDKLRKWLEDLR